MQSETVVALVSAGGGLMTGLTVAYFQRRGDRRDHREALAAATATARENHEAENERQRRLFEAENERLTQQIKAQAVESTAQRRHADTLDWRERRLAAYRTVSNTAYRAEQLATQMADTDPDNFFAPQRPGQEFEDVFAELRVAIDEVELISDGDLLAAANLLWMSADTAKTVALR